MRTLMRILKHRWLDETDAQRALGADALRRIEERVAASERTHTGELRVCVEAGLPLSYLWRQATVRERAIAMFGKLRVWDTEHNNGVLIYLLLADRDVEIVADRGIHARVGTAAWEAICGAMQREFAAGRFEAGVIVGVQAVSDLLATHFPPRPENPDELSNRPVVLG